MKTGAHLVRLAKETLVVTSRFVQGARTCLQYFERGTGPRIVIFVHGYAASARTWKLTQEVFDPQEFRTIAINNRGAGDSDRSCSEDDYTIEGFALDLLDAVKTLGLSGFTLIGHSMGAAIVTQFALDNPTLVQALVLLAPVSLQGRPLKEGWDNRIREEFRAGPPPLDLGTDLTKVPVDVVESIRADAARNPVERALGGTRSMAGLRLRECLHDLEAPVLTIGGDIDRRVDIGDVLADFLAFHPDRRYLHFFHGVGHCPNLEVPTELSSLIGSFIKRAGARPPPGFTLDLGGDVIQVFPIGGRRAR